MIHPLIIFLIGFTILIIVYFFIYKDQFDNLKSEDVIKDAKNLINTINLEKQIILNKYNNDLNTLINKQINELTKAKNNDIPLGKIITKQQKEKEALLSVKNNNILFVNKKYSNKRNIILGRLNDITDLTGSELTDKNEVYNKLSNI